MGEVVEDEDDAHGREGAVQHVQPVAEVPVQPHGRDRADYAGDEDHRLFREAEDVGETQAGRVQGVVVGGPDIEAQHQDGEVEEVQVEHDLEDVVTAHVDAGNRTEQEHQTVADEEGDDRGPEAHARVLGEPSEVRGCRTAGDETAHDEASARDDAQVLRSLGKLLHKPRIPALDGQDHGHGAQDGHRRDGDVTDDRETLDAEIGAGGHQDAGDNDEQVALPGHVVRRHVQAQELLGHRDGEHREAHAKPADLREGDHRTGKPAALGAEAPAGQHVQRQAAFRADPAQGARIGGEDETSQQEGPDEAPPVQSGGELLAHPHAGGEEGEAQHHHEHAQVALASGGIHR